MKHTTRETIGFRPLTEKGPLGMFKILKKWIWSTLHLLDFEKKENAILDGNQSATNESYSAIAYRRQRISQA